MLVPLYLLDALSPSPAPTTALPAIFYNGKTIAFPEQVFKRQLEYPRIAMMNFSASRLAETLNIAADDLHSWGLRNQENATRNTFKRNLYQWWEWATKGNRWTIAADASKTALTTLTAGANVGDTSILVASIVGISDGDQLIIRNSTDQQVIKVSGPPSGNAINLVESLDFAFANGSRVRHEMYWPARLLSTKPHSVVENPPLHFDVNIIFAEDLN